MSTSGDPVWDLQYPYLSGVLGGSREYHRDGVPWNQAPLPRRLHRHKIQTMKVVGFVFLDWCACGAFCSSRHFFWTGRNSRRKTVKS